MDKEIIDEILNYVFVMAKELCNEGFVKDYYYFLTGEENPPVSRRMILDESWIKSKVTYDSLSKSARSIKAALEANCESDQNYFLLRSTMDVLKLIIEEVEDGKKKE